MIQVLINRQKALLGLQQQMADDIYRIICPYTNYIVSEKQQYIDGDVLWLGEHARKFQIK